jgi:uncharacterized protein HemX
MPIFNEPEPSAPPAESAAPPAQPAAPAKPAASAQPAASAEAKASETQPDPAPVAPQETYSGGTLLVLAYVAIWLLVFGFIFVAWQRTRSLEDKLAAIEGGLKRSRDAHEKARAATETTKRSADV